MRALLIDPENQSITGIEFEGDYRAIQSIIGCNSITSGSRPLNGSLKNGFDSLYVSDDYLEDREAEKLRHWFQVDADRNPPSSYPLAGLGLVLGVDKLGESCDARISLAELTSRITFTQRKFRGFEVSTAPGLFKVDLNAPIIDGSNERKGEGK